MKRVLIIIAANLIIIGLVYGAFTRSRTQTIVASGVRPEGVSEEEFTTTDTQILFDPSVDVQSNMAEVRDAIAYFPIPVLEAFNNNDWKIMIVQNVENAKGKSFYDMSYTNFDEKTIQIKYIPTAGKTKLHVLLEMSRFTDVYLDNASEKEDFIRLYNEYAPSYLEYEYVGVEKSPQTQQEMDYAKQNARNFFACTLKDYLYHPDYVLTNYGDLYNYYEALLNKISK